MLLICIVYIIFLFLCVAFDEKRKNLIFFVIKKIWSERSWFFFCFYFLNNSNLFFSLFSPDYLTFSQILILKILFIFHFFLLSRVVKYEGFKVLDRYFLSHLFCHSATEQIVLVLWWQDQVGYYYLRITLTSLSLVFQVELLRMIAKLFRGFSRDILPWLYKFSRTVWIRKHQIFREFRVIEW